MLQQNGDGGVAVGRAANDGSVTESNWSAFMSITLLETFQSISIRASAFFVPPAKAGGEKYFCGGRLTPAKAGV
jgi:hypothetical protein